MIFKSNSFSKNSNILHAFFSRKNRTYKEIDEVLPANKRDELDKMAHESMSFMKK